MKNLPGGGVIRALYSKPKQLATCFLILFVLFAQIATAQKATIPRDTSFTIYSTYQKEVKNRPYVQMAKPPMPAGVLAKKEVVYSTIGDRELHLDVFYPANKSKKKLPAVLLIHGGGWRSGSKENLVPMAQQLAAKGYVTVTAEYRLSPEAKYPAAVHDLKAAVRWMRANAETYNLDKNKIAALGCSAGGQLAALLGTTNKNTKLEGTGGNPKQSSAVQAVIDMDGVLAFKHPESAEGVVASQWLGGTYEEQAENWIEASALTHVGKNAVPILFINSSTPRFHAGREDFIQVLNQHNIYSEVHTFPDTPHPFWLLHPWFNPTLELTVNFLNKNFKHE
ncbi:alpha/beta hydrolase [Adhaeribacter aquaticus]|uniref:alpha/beta hydrolase n=1 Tax=Adhaeribacter aquaticus TaxID=299567 RepID=UPI001FDF7D36|nr:alpha/beta hydrolase [Adhaeribacter aquaticus]